MRALVAHGLNYTCTYTDLQGNPVVKKLLKEPPRVVFKDITQIISISFQFQCPFFNCYHNKSAEEKKEDRLKGVKSAGCPYSRKIRLNDSNLYTNCSLENMVKDMNLVRQKTGLSLERTFKRTYDYMSQHYDRETFEIVCSGKLFFPYQACESWQQMRDTTYVSREAFTNSLKGTGPLSETDHATFTRLWTKLGVTNLSGMLMFYNLADVLQSLDAIFFYFQSLFSLCKLHPCHMLTISSYSVRAALYHSRSPDNSRLPLFLPTYSSKIYSIFQSTLFGGYATVQAKYSQSDYGFVSKPEVENDTMHVQIPRCLRTSSTHDANALYGGSVTICNLPYSDFILLEAENPNRLFREVEKHLMESDWEYFANMNEQYGRSALIVCDVDYDKRLGLIASMDFSMMPRFRSVKEWHVTKEQAEQAKRLGRSLNKEPPKLCSWNQTGEMTDFVDTLAFQIVMLSVKITQVKKILIFRQEAFFRDWLEFLQTKRAETPSKVLNKCVKALGST